MYDIAVEVCNFLGGGFFEGEKNEKSVILLTFAIKITLILFGRGVCKRMKTCRNR